MGAGGGQREWPLLLLVLSAPAWTPSHSLPRGLLIHVCQAPSWSSEPPRWGRSREPSPSVWSGSAAASRPVGEDVLMFGAPRWCFLARGAAARTLGQPRGSPETARLSVAVWARAREGPGSGKAGSWGLPRCPRGPRDWSAAGSGLRGVFLPAPQLLCLQPPTQPCGYSRRRLLRGPELFSPGGWAFSPMNKRTLVSSSKSEERA